MAAIVHSTISAASLLPRQNVLLSLAPHHSAKSKRGVIRPVSYKASRSLTAIRASVSGAGGADDGRVRTITSSEEFHECVREAGDKLVVLDISTKTCGPCKFIYPKVVALSMAYENVVFLKINGDHSDSTKALMREWGVRAVPNFRFFRNGELVHSHTGAKEEDLRNHLTKFAAMQTADA